MKQFRITILLTVLMSMFGVKANAHDIEVANKDGVTIYYKWINDKTELAVCYRGDSYYSYESEYSGDVVIPESVEYEEKNYSVTSIVSYAFRNCSGLISVTIPSSVTSISSYAFVDCSGLTSVTIPSSVNSIGSYAFVNCSGLTSVTIPNSVTSIGEYAFYKCSGLTSVTIPSSATSIGNAAFYSCSGLGSVIVQCIPTDYIGSDIFNECPNLKEVTFDCETVARMFSGNTSIEKVTMKESVTSIGSDAFCNCSGLTSVTIPNSVTSIGSYAFQNCSGLTSVTIPNSVTSIGECAFYDCYSLASVVIGSGVTSIGQYAFYYTNLKKTIWLTNTPPSGASYAQGTINYVSNEEYNISNKVVYPFLSSYFDVDGVRYVPISLSDKTCDAIDCVYDESATNLTIASTVTYKGVSLAVKKIQPYLGYNNKFITSLTFNTNGELGEYAFAACSNIKTVKLGKKVSAIGSHAFENCSSLTAIDIPEIVPVLNEYAFSGCSSLTSIKIKPKMTEIKNAAFYNCTSLKEVIIEDSETELNLGSNYSGSSTYYSDPLLSSCPLDTVYIGRNINYSTDKNYGYSPFYRNTSLRAVKITDKETEISENEFYGCTNLQRMIIGDGVTSIGNWAFSGCQSLKFFTFGSEVKTIGQEAFSDCTAVTEITSRAITPPTCGTQALDDINKWECKLYVPKGHLADYQTAEQWKEFLFAEEGDYTIATKYTLTYMVDGEVYKTYNLLEGAIITPEPAPTKEGYDFSGWSTIPATMPAKDLTITGTFSLITDEDEITIKSTGKTTWCSKYDLDFTNVEGVKAYTATGYNNVTKTIWLTRVMEVPAGTGLLVKGDAGTYKIPHAQVQAYYVNMFVGNLGETISIGETDGDKTNYYLKDGTFKSVNGNANIGKNKAYLQLPTSIFAGTRSIGISYDDEDGTTGIKNLTPALSEGDGEWYTLQGQRVAKPGKGIYIRNGRKIVVR